MKGFLRPNKDGESARPSDSPTGGFVFPYTTRAGFPVIISEEHIEEDKAKTTDGFWDDVVPAPPGFVGVAYPSRVNHVYAIDNNGDMVATGMILPDQVDPQPLEIDPEHPFFAAALRGQEQAREAAEAGAQD